MPPVHAEANVKAKVFVTLKRTVLDPQGATIASALKKMQYKGIEDVRQGKYFELTFAETQDASAVEIEVERIAREVLTNPVIEEFTWTLDSLKREPSSEETKK